MDFSEEIAALADRMQKVKGSLGTEEATKNALVMPFIRTLGYDVFNPLEVVPEFIAEIPGRKGEKVDYALMHGGKPVIFIECKPYGAPLTEDNRQQLHRYFNTEDIRIGILTNGARYLFFSNLEDIKNMDKIPFMEFNLENVDTTLIPELRKLCKGKFDLQTALDTANELKYTREIKRILLEQLEGESLNERFVDFFTRETYQGKLTKTVREQFTVFVRRAFSEFIAERIDDRLKSALAATRKEEVVPVEIAAPEEDKGVTTEQEWQGFYLVKSLLMGTVDSDRVIIKDALSYCNVLLDNNRNKPLIRFHFNNPEKLRIELIGENKERTIHDIKKIDDILQFADKVRATAMMYDAVKKPTGE